MTSILITSSATGGSSIFCYMCIPDKSGFPLRFNILYFVIKFQFSLMCIVPYYELDVKLIRCSVTDIDTDTQGTSLGETRNPKDEIRNKFKMRTIE